MTRKLNEIRPFFSLIMCTFWCLNYESTTYQGLELLAQDFSLHYKIFCAIFYPWFIWVTCVDSACLEGLFSKYNNTMPLSSKT